MGSPNLMGAADILMWANRLFEGGLSISIPVNLNNPWSAGTYNTRNMCDLEPDISAYAHSVLDKIICAIKCHVTNQPQLW